MGLNTSTLKIYSQNVSCDTISEKLVQTEGNEDMVFTKRFEKLLKSLSAIPDIDVIAFNEIRYKNNIAFVEKELDKLEYDCLVFANNDGDLSFNNVLAISRNSKWKLVAKQQKWVAFVDNKPCLENKHCVIEGDPHGRCAGIIYLEYESNPNRKVCVLTSHVCPFGDVKRKQQNALFSIGRFNLDKNPSIPSILVGDFNRFEDEDLDFQKRLKEYGLIEVKSSRLIIPDLENPARSLLEFSEDESIGTFNPWPSDVKIHDIKMKEPLKNSRLDGQVCLDNKKLVRVKDTYTRASMFKKIGDLSEKPNEHNDVRHRLHCNMASDHLAIIGTYEIKE